MNVVGGAERVMTGAGEAATATLGAVGGAAVGGLVGTMKGAAVGAAEGARRGSHSTPAAMLTMGAVALTGVVQWPIVAAVAGTVLVLNQLTPGRKPDTPRSGIRPTGADADVGDTAGAGAKPAAAPPIPAGTAAAAITPAPARKAVRGRRTPAKSPQAKSPTARTSPAPTP